jgi:hypothetical protein
MGFIERTERSFRHWAERGAWFLEHQERLREIEGTLQRSSASITEREAETLRIAATALGNEANECNLRASAANAVMVKVERGELCARCGINKARESECGCAR